MKAWITKHALTAGIEELDGNQFGDHGKYFSVNGEYSLVCENDWHRTREAAIVRAEAMRVAKIASLRKSIAKLEKLRFE